MYWQNASTEQLQHKSLKKKFKRFVKHQHYGYRRITQELKRRGFQVNKKKVQRLIQKLKLQVKALLRNPENIIPIKESLVKSLKI